MIGDSDAAAVFSDPGHDPVGTAVDAALEVALERTTDAEVGLADVDDLADGVAGPVAVEHPAGRVDG